jgi:hypothetical protein
MKRMDLGTHWVTDNVTLEVDPMQGARPTGSPYSNTTHSHTHIHTDQSSFCRENVLGSRHHQMTDFVVLLFKVFLVLLIKLMSTSFCVC